MTITAEQKEFKQGKIGASQSASCLNRNRFGSAAQEFNRIKGVMPAFVDTTATRVGEAMEPTILNEYNVTNGYNAEPYPETLIHPDEPRIIAHCDGKDHKRDVLVEIKNVGPRMKEDWKEDAPEYVKIQACHQSMLDQTPRVDIVAYFGGNDLRVYEQDFKESDWGSLYDGLKDFLGYVDRNECPPLTKADLPFLKYFFKDEGTTVQATPIIENYAKNLHKDKVRVKPDKDIEAHIKEAEFEIQKFMGTNSTLVGRDGDVLFTWKTPKSRGSTDWKAIAEYLWNFKEEPWYGYTWEGAIQHFTYPKEGSRRFLCKLKSQEN